MRQLWGKEVGERNERHRPTRARDAEPNRSLFRDELGYRYLGDWTDRDGNNNIDEDLLTSYLTRCGYRPTQIRKAIYKLRTEAGNPNRSLYDNNKAVYSLLRYGVCAGEGRGGRV